MKDCIKDELADELLQANINKAKHNFADAVKLYRGYVGKAETDEERKRRINRFRCG